MPLASTNCVGAGLMSVHSLWSRPYDSVGCIGYESQSRSRAVDVVLHLGRPANSDRPDNFSLHLDGKPATHARYARKRGDAAKSDGSPLDEVEKVLSGDAEQSGCTPSSAQSRWWASRPQSIRLKALRLPPSSRIATFSL